MRSKLLSNPRVANKTSRRWSTPAEVVSGSYTPERPLPVVPRNTSGPLGLPRLSSRPSSASRYSQPEWVIHHLPPVEEEIAETKAERTSRHLRETSGHRGRSVSPPSPKESLSPPRPTRRSSVVGPRPPPGRSTSAPISVLGLSRCEPSLPQPGGTVTPPLLSPMPLQIEPNSYFDQQVHSLPLEAPLDIGKLSPATILSLESFADRLEPSPLSSGSHALSLEGDTSAVPRPGSRSPVRERRSVLEVFATDQKPEVRRRESRERRVAVERRDQREASCVAEVFDEASDTLMSA